MRQTLAEQLAALKSKQGAPKAEIATSPGPVKIIRKVSPPQTPETSFEPRRVPEQKIPRLVYQLPMWGVIQRVVYEKGFGFISCPSIGGEVFFHFSRQQPTRDPDEARLQVGKPMFFILGADRDKPGRRSAVRWALLGDLSWGVQALRRQASITCTSRSMSL